MKNLATVVEKENLSITYLIKGKVYRKFKLPVDVSYVDNDGILTATTTYNDIKTLIQSHIQDVTKEQIEAKFSFKTKGTNIFVGTPSDVNIELNIFQQRILKMDALEIN